VYVNYPRDDPDWKPHTNYHASGQNHQKSSIHKDHQGRRQRPELVGDRLGTSFYPISKGSRSNYPSLTFAAALKPSR
jgi:hypothetical protein